MQTRSQTTYSDRYVVKTVAPVNVEPTCKWAQGNSMAPHSLIGRMNSWGPVWPGCPKQYWSLSCCSLNFATRCPVNKKSSLVKMMTWHQIGDEILLNLRWPCCLIAGLAWPGDAIWRHRSGSTLAQVTVWCLTAPRHYLNQCWLAIRKVQWESPEGNFTRNISVINH